MDLNKFYSPGVKTSSSKYSDKRTKESIATSRTKTTHEGDVIKMVTTSNIGVDEGGLYPTTYESTLPKSFLNTGINKTEKQTSEYGTIHIDTLLVGDALISHFHSENSEHRGSSIVKQLTENEFFETGFAYNAPDDILKWEKKIKIEN